MPDFERPLRDLRLAISSVDEQCYWRGYFAGQDNARWQIVIILAGILFVAILVFSLVLMF